MFRASSAHLQEHTVVYMQHMVPSHFVVACRYTAQDYYLFIKYYSPLHVSSLKCSSSGGYSCIHAAYGTVTVRGDLSVHSLRVLTHAVYLQATRNSRREWQYHMLHVYNCILLKMSTWGLKYVEERCEVKLPYVTYQLTHQHTPLIIPIQ